MKKLQNNHPHSSIRFFLAASEVKIRLSLGAMVGTMASGAIALFPLAAQAASLTQWHYDPTANRLEVTVDEGTTPRYFLMAQPARIVLDLPDTAVGNVISQASYSGAVRQIRVSQFQPGLTRIVLELSPDVELAPTQVKLEKVNQTAATSRWVLHPMLAQAGSLPPTAKVSEPTPPAAVASKPGVAPSNGPMPFSGSSNSSPPTPFPVETPAPISMAPTPVKPAPVPTLQPASSAPVRVVQAEKILPPPTPIPIGSDDGLKDPDSTQVAQTLPPASVTPLPPSSAPADLAIDTRNAIKLSVPPPLSSIPTQPPAVTSAPPTPLPAAAVPLAPVITPPAAASAAPAKPVTVPSSLPGANSFAMDMPSTVRMAPGATPSITVPPLGSPQPSSVPSVAPAVALPSVQAHPLPSPMQLPPLSPLPGSFPPASQAPAIAVPPLTPNPHRSVPANAIPPGNPASAQVANTPFPAASVTPLQPAPTFTSPQVAVTPPSTKPTMVAFGQPLPTSGAIALNTFPRGVATYPVVPGQSPMMGSVQPPNAQPPSVSFPGGQLGSPQSGSFQPGMPSSSLPAASVQQAFFQSPNPAVLLPLGATLNLVYPGTTALKLPSGPPLQEVLLLQTEVRDASGAIVLPRGTYVVGRFDTSGNASKFIAQAIAVGQSAIPFAAESSPLGNNRELSTMSMAIGSGVGALLGGVVSSFSGAGLVGGAAAGAATSFLTSPKQVTVQPGQVIPVQVKQDVLVR